MNKKLDKIREQYELDRAAYSEEISKMQARETLYTGNPKYLSQNKEDITPVVKNVVAECIESQVSTSIPIAKVTSITADGEKNERTIEEMLRAEIDRLPIEDINDMQERTCPIQGSTFYLVEWDNKAGTHTSLGDVKITAIHPLSVTPSAGYTGELGDADRISLTLSRTKEYIKRVYDKDVENEGETDTDVRADTVDNSGLCTQVIVFYRNDNGKVSIYSWCGDTELMDIDDYYAKKVTKCKACGTVMTGETCELCGGSKSVMGNIDSESVKISDLPRAVAEKYIRISAQSGIGIPTEADIPCYVPDVYPLVHQKNTSKWGSFMGDSDVDKIADQQNELNYISKKISDKLSKGGSILTLPPNTEIEAGDGEIRTVRLDKASDKNFIQIFTLEGDISQDMAYLDALYNDSKRIIGITDAYQGLPDSTATSGKAKQISAAQSAGRLESKKEQKRSAWAKIYEIIFKYRLAYTQGRIEIAITNPEGVREYKEFNRYDFIKCDDAGVLYWDDEYLFDIDDTATLAADRYTMYQELRVSLQSGALGNPQDIDTLILYWSLMEQNNYPGATTIKSKLEGRRNAQAQQAAPTAVQGGDEPVGNQDYINTLLQKGGALNG